ncbi:MAG: glycosyltransferase [Candidatus Omnitrophica bacterium]|nr:glycosyltransferase [Candidatus Omnitrophota bacterium]
MRKILFVAGGSGGHVFPAVAVIEDILNRHPEWKTIFGTDERCKQMVRQALSADTEIRLAPYTRIDGRHRSFWTPFKFVHSVYAAAVILKKINPDLVMGFGGYVCIPSIVAARFLGIPCITHEQNVRPGKANLLLKKLGIPIAYTFKPDCASEFWSGYPIRKHMVRIPAGEAKIKLGLNPDQPVLLITGGSQGAQAVNSLISGILGCLKGWQILHLTGSNASGLPPESAAYKKMEFCADMTAAYSAADMVISRAGAGALHEIAAFRKKAVIIPYPHAGSHQKANAEACAGSEFGTIMSVIDEAHLSDTEILRLIQQLQEKPSIIEDNFLNNSGHCMRFDGTGRLADKIEALIEG